MIRRRQFIELEDIEGFPKWIRDYGTDFLRYVCNLLHPFDVLEERVAHMMREMEVDQIVDLCSGGAGPLMDFINGLEKHGALLKKVTMTDKYPNIPAFAYTSKLSQGRIGYSNASIDASNVPATLPGLRTLFNSFHHFPPTLAKSILQNAVDRREPIVIAEFIERWLALPLLMGLGIFAYITAPFIKPFSIRRLLSFWVLPVVPLFIMWDGFVSCLRIYSPQELKELVDDLKNTENYIFDIGLVSSTMRVTYLIGHPSNKNLPASRKSDNKTDRSLTKS